MTYRITSQSSAEALVLVFEGLLDAQAVEALRARLRASPVPVRLVLRVGTEVDPGLVETLRELPAADIVAESPFLESWLFGSSA